MKNNVENKFLVSPQSLRLYLIKHVTAKTYLVDSFKAFV